MYEVEVEVLKTKVREAFLNGFLYLVRSVTVRSQVQLQEKLRHCRYYWSFQSLEVTHMCSRPRPASLSPCAIPLPTAFSFR